MSENLPVELTAVEAQTSGPGIAELIDEIRLLRAELVLMRAVVSATCGNSHEIKRLMERVMPDGDAIATREQG